MANYKHGVYVKETPTSLIPPVYVDSAVTVVVGTAPVNMTDSPQVNKPVLVQSYSEAVAAFGFQTAQAVGNTGDKKFAYTLNEFMYANFNFAGIKPCILINVLDPARHVKAAVTTKVRITKGIGTVAESGIIKSSVSLKTTGTVESIVLRENYVLTFADNGDLIVSSAVDPSGNDLLADGEYTIVANAIDPSAVTKADIIGGIDAATNEKKGLELIGNVYPKFRLIPSLILVPGFSQDPEVAGVMAAKSVNINGHFNAIALVDIPTVQVKNYSEAPNFKNQNSLVNPQQVVCWPCARISETIYNLSTILAGVIGTTDAANDNVPYCSPSNNNAPITGLCLADGSEVVIGNEECNYLNGQGIVTCLNFNSGWVIWGNRTASYPGNTDPKDSFIPVKRMFYWVENSITLQAWQKVDKPMNRRLVGALVDSINVWLNGLVSREQLLGGKVEFREEDNPTTDLMDGIMHFKLHMTPPSPNRDLEFDFSIDVKDYQNLFD